MKSSALLFYVKYPHLKTVRGGSEGGCLKSSFSFFKILFSLKIYICVYVYIHTCLHRTLHFLAVMFVEQSILFQDHLNIVFC